jgi:hypothetical protein
MYYIQKAYIYEEYKAGKIDIAKGSSPLASGTRRYHASYFSF